MKRVILRLCIALLTFALGVAAVMFYLASNVPIIGPPAAEGLEAPAAPVASTCYPGRSVKTQVMGRLLYFPPGVFSTNEWRDQFRRDWYSKHLEAMHEASFYFPDSSEEESYRFLWLRSFHHPVAVRVRSSGGGLLITVKELSGAGGHDPGKLTVNRTRKVAKEEWDEFIRLIEQTCYWGLPTEDEGLIGEDGAQWILEGVRSSRYHIVDRWSPRNGSYREACLYMLKLSGLGVDASSENVY
jgi:hypothetical protein